ncbi:MAG: amidase family protein, partial [Candidatus Nanopelagicales bacterium]
MTDLHHLTALEQAAAIRSRELSPVELTEHYLSRAHHLNEAVGAFITQTPQLAMEQAREAEHVVLATSDPRNLDPLHGVVVPVKDLNNVAGVRCTRGSKVYAD